MAHDGWQNFTNIPKEKEEKGVVAMSGEGGDCWKKLRVGKSGGCC